MDNTTLTIIILLAIIIIFLIIIIVLINRNSQKQNSEINHTIQMANKQQEIDIAEMLTNNNNNLNTNFNNLIDRIDTRLDSMDDKIETKLNTNLNQTNLAFQNLLTRLTKIDEAQKRIDELSVNIDSLQNILTDKKSRGTFGENNLYTILSNQFGENEKVWKRQYTLSNGYIADSVVFAPEPLGMICIDSKFPLENYQRLIEDKKYNTAFENDVKKHINDISRKYITDETCEYAIMFIPAEAIFAEINAYHQGLIDYAQNKKVAICSPTTLMAMLTIIQSVLLDLERNKNFKIMKQELNLLNKEFERYTDRWNKLANTIDTVSNEVKDLHTTTKKISNRFASINNVELESEALEYFLDD